MNNLLGHHINKFGVVDVMDVILYDTATNKPILLLDTLKITSINQEASQKEIKGGIGAPDLIIYDYARTVSVEIQDALASLPSLSVLWGGSLIDGNIKYNAVFEAKIADNKGLEIEVPATITIADNADAAQILIIAGDKVYEATSIEGTKIKLTGGAAGETVKVFIPASIASEPEEGVMALAISSASMPPTVRLVGRTFFLDRRTGKKRDVEIEIPLLKLNVSGGLTMEAEGDAAVFDFNGRALVDPLTKNFFVVKNLNLEK